MGGEAYHESLAGEAERFDEAIVRVGRIGAVP